MDNPNSKWNAEALLEHASWVRGLAASLVLDQNLAEDIAQETMTVALEKRPAGLRSMKAWLATVTRNVAINAARSEKRRVRREQVSAKSELTRDSDELSARLAQHRKLVELVTALEEPYRSTVLLRFFEGLSTQQIGDRLGIPPATVRTRLSRALEKLRGDLDREFGNREAWCAAMLSLAGLQPAAAVVSMSSLTTILRGMIMAMKWKLSVAGLCLLVAILFWKNPFGGGKDPSAVETAKVSVQEPPLHHEENVVVDPGVPTAREEIKNLPSSLTSTPEAKAATSAEKKEDAVEDTRTISIIVVDPEGKPVPQATIEMWTGDSFEEPFERTIPNSTLLCDDSGRFQFVYPTQAIAILASKKSIGISGVYSVYDFSAHHVKDPETLKKEIVIRLMPERKLTGRVLRADKTLASGAEVHITADSFFNNRAWVPQGIKTDAQGVFETIVCRKFEYKVWAEEKGEKTNSLVISAAEGSSSNIELQFPGAYSISGILFNAKGKPIANYFVYAQLETEEGEKSKPERLKSITNADGTFQIRPSVFGKFHVFAYGDNFSSSACELAELSPESPHRSFTLRLSPAEFIQGRLLDSNKQPLAGVRIHAKLAESVGCSQITNGPFSFELTTQDGSFKLGPLLAHRNYSLFYGFPEIKTVISNRQYPLLENVISGARDLEIIAPFPIPQQAPVSVKVVSALTGEPIAISSWSLREGDGQHWESLKTSILNGPQSSIELNELIEGKYYLLVITASGFAPYESKVWVAKKGGEGTPQPKLLQPGSVQVQVLDSKGVPASYLEVSVRHLESLSIFYEFQSCSANESGIAVFSGLSPGEYEASAKKGDKIFKSSKFQISENTTTAVSVQLKDN